MGRERSAWWQRAVAAVGLVVVAGGGWWFRSYERITPLEYDAVTAVAVGRVDVAIRTESFSITDGDNGAAKVTIVSGDQTVVVDSYFNNDLFSDVRPGYLTRRDVDGDGHRDLVLWIDGINALEATAYVSGADGSISELDVTLERPRPW